MQKELNNIKRSRVKIGEELNNTTKGIEQHKKMNQATTRNLSNNNKKRFD